MSKLTILVTGAAGQQGGAVARALLARGHDVLALSRKPDAPAAQALRTLGAKVVTGGFDDPASLQTALEGVERVYGMSTPYEAGMEAETRQGLALLDAVKKANVKHYLFSSVASADRKTGIPHFDSKAVVETALRTSGVPHTVLAPVFFMENLLSPWMLPGLQQGNYTMAMPAGQRLQQVALVDHAALAVKVFENRDAFLGKRLDVASDEVSGADAAAILTRVTGRPIQFVEQPIEQVRAWSADAATMYEWFVRTGYSTDIAALRRQHPETGWHSFEQWAAMQDWSVLKQPIAG
jgi:uncharacterized protein YbjT (DUF2867 family)